MSGIANTIEFAPLEDLLDGLARRSGSSIQTTRMRDGRLRIMFREPLREAVAAPSKSTRRPKSARSEIREAQASLRDSIRTAEAGPVAKSGL